MGEFLLILYLNDISNHIYADKFTVADFKKKRPYKLKWQVDTDTESDFCV